MDQMPWSDDASVPDGDECNELASTRQLVALTGRPDIDTAMLFALKQAMPGDPSVPAPRQAETDKDQAVRGDHALMPDAQDREASALVGRADIDTAMLMALQQARPPDHSLPASGHSALRRNQLGAEDPPGEG